MAPTVSIRRSLLRNLVVVILLLSGAIFVTMVSGARKAVGTLSASIIRRTIDHTEARLREFFDPVVRELLIARSWGEKGLLDTDEPGRINALLVPLMRHRPQVTSLMVADGRGREHMILRLGSRWRNRRTRRDEWGDHVRWLEWTDTAPEPVESAETLTYDPRGRPWYEEAIERREETRSTGESPLHWTTPYTFFTTKDPGITASVTFDAGDGLDHVIGFDVMLKDISRFTTSPGLQATENSRVFVVTEEDQVIGLPREERFESEEARVQALMKLPQDTGIDLIVEEIAAHRARPEAERGEPFRFASGGEEWWGGVTRYRLGPDRFLWIGVAVPEADLLGELLFLRWLIPLIALGVLALAIGQAHRLAGRLSRPIEALVRESDRIRRGDLEPGKPIASPIEEVQRMAAAQDDMRTGLQSLMKLERDLQLARQIQQDTFPRDLPALRGFEIAGWSEPADETGGDTYDVIGVRSENGSAVLCTEDAERAVFLLADAAGHGIGPALSVTQIRAMLRMAVRMQEDLAGVAHHLNEQLCADLTEGRFITAWLGELDARSGSLTSFTAGQGPILHYAAAESAFHARKADAPPFGLFADLPIRIPPPLTMKPGDLYVVLSDGFYESANASRKLFGVEGVQAVILDNRRNPAQEILDALRAEVASFTSGAPADDDRTAIILKRTG